MRRTATMSPSLCRRIARRRGLAMLVLFGSRARGDFRPDSDVDVCVVGGPPEDDLDLQGELSQTLRGNVDLVRFEGSGPLLRFHAIFSGRLLAGDSRAFERLRLRVLKEWQDSRKLEQALKASLDQGP